VAPDEQKSVARARLMERAQNGDREAFYALFQDIGPLVTRFLRRRLPDRGEIEDVCQEALIAVYRSRHTYQPTRPFEPWLFAIVRRVSAEHLRRSRIQSLAQVEMNEESDFGAQDDSGLAVELDQALERLSPAQKQALSLTKLFGLSLAEASRRAGTTVGSMKVRIHRAHQSLRRSLTR
jgi:RNA polymerase sigma-70 factor (ECF subfamily)